MKDFKEFLVRGNLVEMPEAARRCTFCTSVVAPV
jgi:hypothetical protein